MSTVSVQFTFVTAKIWEIIFLKRLLIGLATPTAKMQMKNILQVKHTDLIRY